VDVLFSGRPLGAHLVLFGCGPKGDLFGLQKRPGLPVCGSGTGKAVGAPFTGHTDDVLAIAFTTMDRQWPPAVPSALTQTRRTSFMAWTLPTGIAVMS
jgi:hypothetical protein